MSRVPTPRRPLKRARGGIPPPWERRVRPRIAAARLSLARRAAPGAELKFLDTAKAATTTSATGTIFSPSLNVIVQDTGESERVGRKVVIQAIHMEGIVKIPTTATAADTSDYVRIIVYQDKQTNGAAATVTNILETATVLSFNNLANKSRFQTLMDHRVSVNCSAGSGRGTTDTLSYGESQENFSWHKKCNIAVEYDNTVATGAIESQRSNNIGVLVISGEARASVAYNVRIRYTD